jgi:hypothetical protein
MFNSYENFVEFKKKNIQPETLVLIYDEQVEFPEHIKIDGFFLVECLKYEDGGMNLVLIRRPDNQVDLNTKGTRDMTDGISITTHCTDDEIYRPFLLQNFPRYKRELCGKYDLNVTFYGQHPLKQLDYANIMRKKEFLNFYSPEKVSMGKYDHVLLSDVDIYYPPAELNRIIEFYNNNEHQGILNLKHYKTMAGNGQYFGRRDVVLKNLGDRFEGFWYKDTEFLMNLSRIGHIPTVLWVKFERGKHIRQKKYNTESWWYKHNQNLFREVMKYGR